MLKFISTRRWALAFTVLLILVLPLQGCAAWPWTKTAYEQWRAVCAKDLGARPDVAQEAAARRLDVADFAEALCELSDVVAPFMRSTRSVQQASPPGDQAVAAARALGAM